MTTIDKTKEWFSIHEYRNGTIEIRAEMKWQDLPRPQYRHLQRIAQELNRIEEQLKSNTTKIQSAIYCKGAQFKGQHEMLEYILRER